MPRSRSKPIRAPWKRRASAAEDPLAGAGYEQYEVSPIARPGRRSRHNVNYWKFGDYLGSGAGAHGKISFPDRVPRHARAKQPTEYLKNDALVNESVVPVGE